MHDELVPYAYWAVQSVQQLANRLVLPLDMPHLGQNKMLRLLRHYRLTVGSDACGSKDRVVGCIVATAFVES